MTTHPRIAIVGAGPGGLLCARVLQQRGIEVTVYDADASVNARNQGGTLDLHADTGQIALREAGLLGEFFALARPEGQSHRRFNSRGELLMEHVAAEGEDAAPEIDRGQLRALLADSLTPGTIRWGHRLISAQSLGQGAHRLSFENGASIETDLVIGADGAWSRVRPLVSDALPSYTGMTFVEAWFNDVDRRHPGLAELVGGGHAFAWDDKKTLIAQRNSGGHIRAYIGLLTDLHWDQAAGIDLADTQAVRQTLLGMFGGWDPRLLTIITDNDGPYINRPLYALPAPHTWPHTPGVTLLGDAAHLMTPFGGYGANLALLDGCELALSLAHEDSVDAAITAYERGMLPRSGKLALEANGAVARFSTRDESRPADFPDFNEAAAQYKQAAAEYESRGSGQVGNTSTD